MADAASASIPAVARLPEPNPIFPNQLIVRSGEREKEEEDGDEEGAEKVIRRRNAAAELPERRRREEERGAAAGRTPEEMPVANMMALVAGCAAWRKTMVKRRLR